MEEFELQSWERELQAWRRKISGMALSPALADEMEAASGEIARVRERLRDGIHVSGDRVLRHFARLRALWEYFVQGDESRTTPA